MFIYTFCKLNPTGSCHFIWLGRWLDGVRCREIGTLTMTLEIKIMAMLVVHFMIISLCVIGYFINAMHVKYKYACCQGIILKQIVVTVLFLSLHPNGSKTFSIWHSIILCGGSADIFRVWIFCTNLIPKTKRKQEILKQINYPPARALSTYAVKFAINQFCITAPEFTALPTLPH